MLAVHRGPNGLDESAIDFSSILDALDIEHVFVAGYVAVLAGRARTTDDIGVLLGPVDENRTALLTSRLEDEDYWGPAMPLDDMYEMLSDGDDIWVAPDDEVIPHLEVEFTDDEYDTASLENAITAEIGNARIPIGPFGLQIA